MEIIHVPYKEIDRKKWDTCIRNASHGSIYVTTMYADAMAGSWDALIAGDYEILMPLYYRKKAGIKYLYQPAFLPQTGIFSKAGVPEETIQTFIDKAFSIFSFAEISFSYPVIASHAKKNMKLKELNNFVVDLSSAYEKVHDNYAAGFIKSLNRLKKLSLQYTAGDDVKEVMLLYKKLYLERITGLSNADVNKFTGLCISLQQKNDIVIRKACSSTGELLCAALLIRYGNRLYNMISCITPAGKKAEANYFLYDKIMEEFSGKGMVLDLEGSDIKGIADFYRKMGPRNEPACFIRYNNLPGIIRLLKK